LQEFLVLSGVEVAPATKRIPKKILYGIAAGISVVAGANSCNGPYPCSIAPHLTSTDHQLLITEYSILITDS